MGTVTITFAGFASLPATAPIGWPPNVAYPGAIAVNGSHGATLADAELVQLVTWIAATQFGDGSLKPAPTALQLLLAWIGPFFSSTRGAIQNHFTTHTPPPPINLN